MALKNRMVFFGRHVVTQSIKSCKTMVTDPPFSTKAEVILKSRALDTAYGLPTISQLQVGKSQPFSFGMCQSLLQRSFSTSSQFLQTADKPSDDTETNPSESKDLSIYQRFKRAYKEHGKVLVGVHLLTSSVWISSFYYLVVSGVDIVPIIESWELFSDDKIAHLKSSHAKDIVQAYLMYKLATPVRYTVTLLGTNFTIKYFQKTGKMPKAEDRERLKDLVKDGRQEFKAKRQEIDSHIKTRTSNLRTKRKPTKPGNDSS